MRPSLGIVALVYNTFIFFCDVFFVVWVDCLHLALALPESKQPTWADVFLTNPRWRADFRGGHRGSGARLVAFCDG